MQKNSNSRSAAPSKSSSLLAGILLGMVVGLLIAGGIAWYILKTPSPFVDKVPHESVKLEPDHVKPAPAPVAKTAPQPVSGVAAAGVAAVSGVDDGKPRFEFYKVLTDKQDGTMPASTDAKPADKPAGKEAYFLQAGAFNNPADADKLKAKLAMLGIEANVQTATLPDKVVWHRVRLGPYKNTDEMNKVAAQLKQSGVNTTPARSQ